MLVRCQCGCRRWLEASEAMLVTRDDVAAVLCVDSVVAMYDPVTQAGQILDAVR